MSLGHERVELLPSGELGLEGLGSLGWCEEALVPSVTPVSVLRWEILLERVGRPLGQEEPDNVSTEDH